MCFRMLTYHLLVSCLNMHDPAYPPAIMDKALFFQYNCRLFKKGFSHCFPLPCLITGCTLLTLNTHLSMTNIGNHGLLAGKTYRITMVLHGFPNTFLRSSLQTILRGPSHPVTQKVHRFPQGKGSQEAHGFAAPHLKSGCPAFSCGTTWSFRYWLVVSTPLKNLSQLG